MFGLGHIDINFSPLFQWLIIALVVYTVVARVIQYLYQSVKRTTAAASRSIVNTVGSTSEAIAGSPKTIMAVEAAKDLVNPTSVDDADIYGYVFEEIKNSTLDQGVWAKAYSITEGDPAKAEALYIKMRVKQIKTEIIKNR